VPPRSVRRRRRRRVRLDCRLTPTLDGHPAHPPTRPDSLPPNQVPRAPELPPDLQRGHQRPTQARPHQPRDQVGWGADGGWRRRGRGVRRGAKRCSAQAGVLASGGAGATRFCPLTRARAPTQGGPPPRRVCGRPERVGRALAARGVRADDARRRAGGGAAVEVEPPQLLGGPQGWRGSGSCRRGCGRRLSSAAARARGLTHSLPVPARPAPPRRRAARDGRDQDERGVVPLPRGVHHNCGEVLRRRRRGGRAAGRAHAARVGRGARRAASGRGDAAEHPGAVAWGGPGRGRGRRGRELSCLGMGPAAPGTLRRRARFEPPALRPRPGQTSC
jgi:hypothetical protein